MDVQILDISNPLWTNTLEVVHHDVYHLPQYFYLEAQRINATAEAILIAAGEKIFFLPYLLRQGEILVNSETKQKILDVISPYGYPGFLLSDAAANTPEFLRSVINQLTQILHERQVCSAFIRLHPLLNNSVDKYSDSVKINGETVSIDLTLSESELWQQTRPDQRNKINRAKRFGFQTRMVPPRQFIKVFNKVYEEAMDRVGAKRLYYFGEDFFEKLADSLGDKIHLCLVELNEEVACAGLFTECCGIVQYHLSGTSTNFLKLAPNVLMLDYVRLWAKERGNLDFHLGGGVGGSREDSLYKFKAGFSKRRNTFLTLRLIVNVEKYHYLVDLQARALQTDSTTLLNSGFFPAYRFSGF
ncbi:MAG: aminoacyltransferase [Goleter apudmare HA4340-LM2]|jgi:hypothetical protein|nr:aminoacyltransferase [Goleter apudmare HA4340-LM2]